MRDVFAGRAAAAASALAIAWLAILAFMLATHVWIVDSYGKPIVTDFLEVWVAGQTALSGHPYAAYDPALHHAAEVAVAGHPFQGHLWWHYPPLALFLAAGLALLPYFTAFLVWVGAILAAYGAVVRAIAGKTMAALVAFAAPAAFLNTIAGQNGCLSAALLGAALLNLESRPALAGVLLGLLTYKPQLGLLIPVVLAAAGYWRTFAVAAIVSVLAIAIPTAVFGMQTLHAFLHYLPLAGTTMLVDNAGGWNKLQSLYALCRWLGLGNTTAWALQLSAALACAIALVCLWRSRVSGALKAAGLTVAVLLATPYLYMYDYPILTLTFAFLYRERSFSRPEFAAVAAANLFIVVYTFGVLVAPLGPFAAITAAAMVIRRYVIATAGLATEGSADMAPSFG